MQNHETVHILTTDVATSLVKIIDNLDKSASEKQEIKLKLQNVKGPIEFALDIATAAHSAQNIDLSIVASGFNNAAGAILMASGKPGNRLAQMGTTFSLNEGNPYEDGTKPNDLEDDDKVVYQTLSALTGRKKYILDAIIKGGDISTATAKKCGIIDSVLAFKSKYLLPKPKKEKTASTSLQVQTTESAQQAPVTETPRGRGRRKKQ